MAVRSMLAAPDSIIGDEPIQIEEFEPPPGCR
jgi:hypothetical protein